MKKLVIVCLAFAYSNAFSQNFITGIVDRLSFGVKAGANYSNFYNATFHTDALTGFHAGAVVNFKMSNHFSIEEDFLFSTQGAKTKENPFGQQTLKMYYLAVPIMLKYSTGAGLYLEAGTQTNLLLKNADTPQLSEPFAKKIDMGVAGGIGYKSKSGLGIGARYIAGLTSVGNFKSTTISPDFKNSTVQASVFYIFHKN